MPLAITTLATSLKIFIEGEGQMPDTVSGRASAASKIRDNSIAQAADQTHPHGAQKAACLIDGGALVPITTSRSFTAGLLILLPPPMDRMLQGKAPSVLLSTRV